MFVRETIERCADCGELTPHSTHRLPLAPVFAGACLAAAGWCCYLGEELALLGVLLLVVGLVVVGRDHYRYRHVPWERCRVKRVARYRKTRPTLDGNTEIHLLG